MLDKETVAGWRGHEMVDRDGEKIGKISELYLDQQSDKPEWVTVKTGLFGTRETFVPIRDADSEGEMVRVPFEKGQVKEAPNVDSEQDLTHEEEKQLYQHYGIEYSRDRSDSVLPEHGSEPGQEEPRVRGDSAQTEAEGQESAGGEDSGPATRETSRADAQRGADPGPTAAGAAGAQAGAPEQMHQEDRNEAAGGGPGRVSGVGPARGGTDDQSEERGTSGASGEAGDRSETGADGDRVETGTTGDRSETGAGGDRAPTGSTGDRSETSATADRPGSGDLAQGMKTTQVGEEAVAGEGDEPLESRLRLKKYVVKEEVRIPVEREEVRVERD